MVRGRHSACPGATTLPITIAVALALACTLLLWAAYPPTAAAATTAAPTTAAAPERLLPPATKGEEFLPPDQAFRLDVRAEAPDRVVLKWVIAPGYYLYQSRLKFATTTAGVTLGKADLPAGVTKHDEYFGEQVIYHDLLTAHLPVARGPQPNATLGLNVTYQGCAVAGLCYPPITKSFNVALPNTAAFSTGASSGTGRGANEQDRLALLIRSGSMPLVLATFFGLGLLLAFTPCVLPMVPILSGLIAGQGKQTTTGRSFALSLAYVLGMAATYTLAGALTAALGLQVQALFQQPWIVMLFAALFIAMALSMFGLYTLQMPAAIQTRLAASSNRQRSGSFGGVAIMGALSALIVTTCVAPPLVATLAVIGQSGDVVRGASALFAMSLGMGAPLLVVGASAGRLLPKAGVWMDAVKKLFGVMMLGVAAWMLARLVSERMSLLLFAIPLVVAVAVLWPLHTRGALRVIGRVSAAAAAGLAIVLCWGAWRGATDPLHPFAAPATSTTATATALPFTVVANVSDLDRAVAAAARDGRAVMLDFYADWCVSCREMERNTFADSHVAQALRHLTLLRADVTANSAEDQALLRRFGIYGPPTIAFYGSDGHEQPSLRVVGFMKAGPFAQLLSRVTAPSIAAAPGA